MMGSIVEVAHAKPGNQVIVEVLYAPHITVQQVIEASGVLQKFPEIDLAVNRVGVFGKLVPLDAELIAGDRVEIYRPLVVDPKEARRRRAKAVAAKKAC